MLTISSSTPVLKFAPENILYVRGFFNNISGKVITTFVDAEGQEKGTETTMVG